MGHDPSVCRQAPAHFSEMAAHSEDSKGKPTENPGHFGGSPTLRHNRLADALLVSQRETKRQPTILREPPPTQRLIFYYWTYKTNGMHLFLPNVPVVQAGFREICSVAQATSCCGSRQVRWFAPVCGIQQLQISLGPPAVPFYRFFFGCEGSPAKIDYRQNIGYPCSNLSTGRPSCDHWNAWQSSKDRPGPKQKSRSSSMHAWQ